MRFNKMAETHISPEELLSKTFDFLRFPLIVGVIFIHTFTDQANLVMESTSEFQYPVFHVLAYTFSQVIGRVSVPLFFFMSGYLFFNKIVSFDTYTYLSKLKKRVKSLLIPYLFWCTAFMAIYLLLTQFPFLSKIINGNLTQSEHTLNADLIEKLIIGRPTSVGLYMPLTYQFWFIRDLICCVIISPIIYFIVKKIKWAGIILLGVAWMTNFNLPIIGFRGFSTDALFFFCCGAWFSTRNYNIVWLTRDFKAILFLYPIWIIVDIFTQSLPYHTYIHRFGILLGIIFFFTLTSTLLRKQKIKPIPVLSAASFFIFAIHEPFLLSNLRKLFFFQMLPQTDLFYCIGYIFTVICTTLISFAIYKILAKLTPKFLSLITGGRGN